MRFTFYIVIVQFLAHNTYSQKLEAYKIVNESIVKNYYKDYKIDVPDNWISHTTDPGLIAHTPKNYKDSIGTFSNTPSLIIRKERRSRDINHLLKEFLVTKKSYYKIFQYEILKIKHPIYNNCHVVVYETLERNGKVRIMCFLINDKRKSFAIYYSSNIIFFDDHISDVEKMVNSFRILN